MKNNTQNTFISLSLNLLQNKKEKSRSHALSSIIFELAKLLLKTKR